MAYKYNTDLEVKGKLSVEGQLILNNSEVITRVPKIQVPTGTTEQHIEPNKYYIFNSQVAPELTLTFAEDGEELLDEFMGEIQVDETDVEITLPKTIRWNTPEGLYITDSGIKLSANYFYVFSIVNNVGIMVSIDSPKLTIKYTLTDNILTWEPDPNATLYRLYNATSDELLLETTSTTIDLSNYFDTVGRYDLDLVAVSDTYTDGTSMIIYYKREKLATPTNFVLSDTYQLSWDSVENASKYRVTLLDTNNDSLEYTDVTVNMCDLLTAFTSLQTSGTYKVTVYSANDTNEYYTNSDDSEPVTVVIA